MKSSSSAEPALLVPKRQSNAFAALAMKSSPRRPIPASTRSRARGLLKRSSALRSSSISPTRHPFEDKAVMNIFETSGRNLLAAEKNAGVKHHIALSVVGTERLQESGYFRAKLAQEKLIKASGIALHHRAFDAVHGVSERYRPVWYCRRYRPSVASLCATDRLR